MSGLRRILLGVVVVFICVTGLTRADDQMRCCMKGLKSMKHVDLCDAPCCPGYHEEVAEPPNLAPVIWCEKNKKSNLLEKLARYAKYNTV